ncbi:lipoprotein NlpD [Klebsiella variicola]|nr:lipoprotein NlpD [Klebsiella variicola]
MLITPPSSGVKSAPQAQPIQPVQTQTIQPQPTPMAQEPVQTVNGKIVYNRKYGDIPKGSYTGGSTYTVKRGDTLFISRGSPATISATWRNATMSRPRTR